MRSRTNVGGVRKQKQYSVIIAEENRLFRDCLSRALRNQTDVEVIMVNSLLQIDHCDPPNIILLQYAPCLHGRIQELRKAFPAARFVAINADAEHTNPVDCLKAGVVGFISREADARDVIATIRNTLIGRNVIPPDIASSLCRLVYEQQGRQSGNRHDIQEGSPGRLTRREMQIMQSVVEGLSNKEIGNKLNIATHTVKSHVHNLLEKLNLRNRVDLAIYAANINGTS